MCRVKATGEIVAIKKMKKIEMVKKNQIGHVRAERDLLANANIPWIVGLKSAFKVYRKLFRHIIFILLKILLEV